MPSAVKRKGTGCSMPLAYIQRVSGVKSGRVGGGAALSFERTSDSPDHTFTFGVKLADKNRRSV